MKRFWFFGLSMTVLLLFVSSLSRAQNSWKEIPRESAADHQPLPFLKAIGVPATATFSGEKYKAFVFISGREKGPGVYHPSIEIYIEGLQRVIPEKELELFEGPAESKAESEIRAMTVSVRRGKQLYQAKNWVNLYEGDYPVSIVKEGGNTVFSSGVFTKGPEYTAWVQLMREMSAGFDEGHISFGGTAPSTKIEVDFSGNGIEPLLKDVIRYVGP